MLVGASPSLDKDPAAEAAYGYIASEAHYLSVAGRILAALRGQGSLVLVTGDPPVNPQPLSQALRKLAGLRNRVIGIPCGPELTGDEVARAGSVVATLPARDGAVTISDTAETDTPLFVFDEADRLSDQQIEEIYVTIQRGAKRNAAAVLLASSAFLSRLEEPPLQSLREALAARMRFDEIGHDEGIDFLRHQLAARHGDDEAYRARPIFLRGLAVLGVLSAIVIGALLALRYADMPDWTIPSERSTPSASSSPTTFAAPAPAPLAIPPTNPPPVSKVPELPVVPDTPAPAPSRSQTMPEPKASLKAPGPTRKVPEPPAIPATPAPAPWQSQTMPEPKTSLTPPEVTRKVPEPPAIPATPAPAPRQSQTMPEPKTSLSPPEVTRKVPEPPAIPDTPAPAPSQPRALPELKASPSAPGATRDGVAPQTPPRPVQPPAGQRPSPDNVALVTRGDALLGTGDIASARLFYERAADAGDGAAALRLGATFDPNFLGRTGIRGTPSDSGQAAFWYRRARDLGDAAAAERLKSLDRQSR
jgi:hypothetical protein